MNVRDVMTKDPATCREDSKLGEVAKMMVQHDTGVIPVIGAGDKPVGVVTDRDIVVRAVAAGKNPLDCTARDAMSTDLVTVKPDLSLEECSDMLEQRRIRRAVVCDERGKIVGILSQADIAKHDEDLAGELVQAVSQEGQPAGH